MTQTLLDPAAAAPAAATRVKTPGEALGVWFNACAAWLRKNFVEALIVAVSGFLIGYVANFILMAFFLDGYNLYGSKAPATGAGNVRNGMLIWGLASSAAFGLFGYYRAVGKERFAASLRNFPNDVAGIFRADGSGMWAHLLWGVAISLLASQLISPWASVATAAVLATSALSPLGRRA
jgi:hypothetical protein